MPDELEIYPKTSFYEILKEDAPTYKFIMEMYPSADGKWTYKLDQKSVQPLPSRKKPSRDMRRRYKTQPTPHKFKILDCVDVWRTRYEHSVEATVFSCRTGDGVFSPKSHVWPELIGCGGRHPDVIVTVGDASHLDTILAYLPLLTTKTSASEGKSRDRGREDRRGVHSEN